MQVERVDRLGEQDAAAVARLGAAARLVVVALRPPVVEPGRGADDLAEPAFADQFGQRDADRAEAVLQHDAELYAAALGHIHEFLGPFEADLQRLFQQDMFAGFRSSPDEIEMGVGRREQQHRADRRVGKDRFGAVADGEAVSFGKSLPALGARAEGSRDLDAVAQLLQAFRMRRGRHAKPDDADPGFLHVGISSTILPAR